MGVGVSSWQLAQAVARAGQLGVVSGTAVSVTLARRLQRGDLGGHARRALAAFPSREIADRIIDRHLRPEGDERPFATVPQFVVDPPRTLVELTIAAAFVEVWLAKEGHDGLVGINLLEKIQLPTLPTLYGAMLADVDWVFVGAGIPARIPAVLDRLAGNEAASLPLAVTGAPSGSDHTMHFDPADIRGLPPTPSLQRPHFAAIVASTTLARYLMGVESGAPDAFVVEMPTAGGHNAPPRGRARLSDAGEPVYGPRDRVDLDDIAALGAPFWVAGGRGDPAGLRDALDHGAAGVQVGTAFAFCDESGLSPMLRRQALDAVRAGTAEVRTDPIASPTGYPFKVAPMADTIGNEEVYAGRTRMCDLGYLREPYVRPDGLVGYRCPAEPVEDWTAKGGTPEDAEGRMCLCNGLVAAIGLGQTRPDGAVELPLLTAGDDLVDLTRLTGPEGRGYTAADVIAHVLSPPAE